MRLTVKEMIQALEKCCPEAEIVAEIGDEKLEGDVIRITIENGFPCIDILI